MPTLKQCESVSQVLKTLAHPQRLMLLCHLTTGPKSVGELVELSGASQSGVSQFLNRMRLEGLVRSEREGQSVLYEIADPKVEKILTTMHRLYCGA